MNLNQVTLTSSQLSDLFFTHDNVNFNNPENENRTSDEQLNELHKDAIAFAALIGNQVTPDVLVEDFMARV